MPLYDDPSVLGILSSELLDTVDTGLGASVTFSGLSAPILSIAFGEMRVPHIDTSVKDTTNYKTKTPGDLIDPSDVTIETLWNTTHTPLTVGDNQTLTITFPLRPSEATAASLAGTAHVISRSYPGLRRNGLQIANIRFAFDGSTGPTFTASVR